MTRRKVWFKASAALLCSLLLLSYEASAAVLGTSEELLRGCDVYGHTNTETSFGDVAADAAAAYAEAAVAILPSEDFGTNVQPGEVTEEVLAACLQNDSALAVVSMSVSQLYELLEIGFSYIVLSEDETIDWEGSYFAGYPQISGITLSLDAAAPAGERITKAALEDGTVLNREDEETTLRVVSTRYLLTGGYGYPAFPEEALEDAGTEREAVAAYFTAMGTVSAPAGDRVTVLGTRGWLAENWLQILLLAAAVCLFVAQLRRSKKREDAWTQSRTATAQEVAQAEEKAAEPPEKYTERKEGTP